METEQTLGDVIRAARQSANLTLRDVERATKARISNGHLSLLEANAVKQPSPHHLFLLSGVLHVDYATLMRLAGYVMPGKAAMGGESPKHGSTIDISDFSDAELHELASFALYIRSKRRR